MQNFGFLNCQELIRYHAEGHSPKCHKLKFLSEGEGVNFDFEGRLINQAKNRNNSDSTSHNQKNLSESTSMSKEDYAVLRYDSATMIQSDEPEKVSNIIAEHKNARAFDEHGGMLSHVDSSDQSILQLPNGGFISTSKKQTNFVMTKVRPIIPGLILDGQMPVTKTRSHHSSLIHRSNVVDFLPKHPNLASTSSYSNLGSQMADAAQHATYETVDSNLQDLASNCASQTGMSPSLSYASTRVANNVRN